MEAYLVLEDGSVYPGTPRGAFREAACEIVFNTSMSGYIEILSDPANIGKGVVMTYPLIGNYGVCREDFESDSLHPEALIVHELCDIPSNFRSEATLEEILKEYNIPCLADIDTRSVVQKLCEKGSMKGIVTDDISDMSRLMKAIADFKCAEPARKVGTKEIYTAGDNNTGAKIAFIDYGTRKSIVKILTDRNCRVTVFPSDTKAETILDGDFGGIFLSDGPGNPAEYDREIKEAAKLFESGKPMLAIGLGYQILALSQGAKVCEMKQGHRGVNHPVRFLENGRTFITSQNHGYAVDGDSLPEGVEVTCENVNDSSVEGISFEGKPVTAVQFTPDANKGASATVFIYNKFIEAAEGAKND